MPHMRRSPVIDVVVALMVGAATAVALTGRLATHHDNDWFEESTATVAAAAAVGADDGEPRNVILFVGDGMGVSTATAARILAEGEEGWLAFEELPYTALSKTYSTDFQVADSAATGTAMMSGIKTDNGVINLDETVQPGVCGTGNPLRTWVMAAEHMGKSTGVVSTARITDATPAAAYAVTPNRTFEDDTLVASAVAGGATSCEGYPDIARQLIEFPYGDGIDVVFGGGRQHFLPDTVDDPEDQGTTGTRGDGRNLAEEWASRPNATWIWNAAQFDALDHQTAGAVLGLFASSHMHYEVDRATDSGGEPSLAEMTATAIGLLSRNRLGFALVVEAGRIDHAHHAGNAARALTDTIALADAVQAAVDLAGPDTLIVVTADHGQTMTISGHPKKGNPILGVGGTGQDGLPYATLSYGTGPGGDIGAGTHSGEDVPIYASGPMAHLFRGVVEQNYIGQVILEALPVDPKVAATHAEHERT